MSKGPLLRAWLEGISRSSEGEPPHGADPANSSRVRLRRGCAEAAVRAILIRDAGFDS
jgi:hypothetical protein